MNVDIEKRRYPMLLLLACMIVLFVCFAAYFEIDQSVRARGQVIPGSRTQVIQVVDGGMLTALHVREGDRVEVGQLLAELEPVRAQAGWVQAEAEVASKRIAIIRSEAELSGEEPVYSDDLKKRWGDIINVQNGIYVQRKRGMSDELKALGSSLGLAQAELKMNQRLYKSGDISQTEVMRAQRQVIEIQSRISSVRNKYLQDSQSELAKLQDDLSLSQAKLDDRHNVLSHTSIRSSSDGVVKFVRVNTVGGVLRAGDELMQISPVDDELVAELKINPADVGQLKAGLPVSLRFDALDSSVYGNVNGTLRYISPDTLNEKGANDQPQIYYRAEVTLQTSTQKGHKISPEVIKPGMFINADVLTGSRTLLYYLAKPIVRAFSGSLTER